MNFEQHPHWSGVSSVLDTLRHAGFFAYLAGGCVRDQLLGREANDFDVATNARPGQIEELFEKTIAVGKAFGVIVIPFEGYQVEVSTFREDGDYSDGRRPDQIVFSEPLQDARRRDFTVNALFYDFENRQIVDFIDGQADIEAKVIRCVGEPDQRFSEDQLRLLRAIRFSTQIGFSIDPLTWEAIKNNSEKLGSVSAERITVEMTKVLQSSRVVAGLQMLRDCDLFSEVFPVEVPSAKRWYQTKKRVKQVEGVLPRLAVLTLMLSPLKMAEYRQLQGESLIKRLQNDSRLATQTLLANWRLSNSLSQGLVKRVVSVRLLCLRDRIRYGALLKFLAGDGLADALTIFQNRYGQLPSHEIEKLKPYFQGTPSAWVQGKDLIELGIEKGPLFGKILQETYYRQLEQADQSRQDQLAWVLAEFKK